MFFSFFKYERRSRHLQTNISYSFFAYQAGSQTDATAKVRAYQETQEQAAARLWLVAGAATGHQSADHPVTTGQSQSTEPGYPASTDVHDVCQFHQHVQQCSAERLRLGHCLRLRFCLARIRTTVICQHRLYNYSYA